MGDCGGAKLRARMTCAAALLAARPPEGTHAKIEKDDHNPGGDEKCAVVGSVGPTGTVAPEVGGEDQHRQQKEDARHLKPENAADPPEGPQKPAHTLRHPPGGSTRGLPGGAAARGVPLDCAGGVRRRCGLRGGLSGRGQALPGHPARNPDSNSQNAADGLRLHFVMMVTATDTEPHSTRSFAIRCCSRPPAGVR